MCSSDLPATAKQRKPLPINLCHPEPVADGAKDQAEMSRNGPSTFRFQPPFPAPVEEDPFIPATAKQRKPLPINVCHPEPVADGAKDQAEMSRNGRAKFCFQAPFPTPVEEDPFIPATVKQRKPLPPIVRHPEPVAAGPKDVVRESCWAGVSIAVATIT